MRTFDLWNRGGFPGEWQGSKVPNWVERFVSCDLSLGFDNGDALTADGRRQALWLEIALHKLSVACLTPYGLFYRTVNALIVEESLHFVEVLRIGRKVHHEACYVASGNRTCFDHLATWMLQV